jgi:UBA-like domain
MSEHEEMITQFCDVTSIEVDRAKFYLEASNWELAVSETEKNLGIPS